MVTHPVVGSVRDRVGSWLVYGAGSGELLSIVTAMAVIVRVGVGIRVVGWIGARCPS